jgi:hypothetical protein
MKLDLVPLTLAQANALVTQHHRHHAPVVSHRFSIGCVDDAGELRGAVIVGRPVSRGCEAYRTAEVTRLVTDGARNACSLLYAAAARAAQAMGYDKIQTYIGTNELGTSLIAAGWTEVENPDKRETRDWNNSPRTGTRRVDQPMIRKRRFEKVFRTRALALPEDSLANASDKVAHQRRREAKARPLTQAMIDDERQFVAELYPEPEPRAESG